MLLTWVQETRLKSGFERGKELLPLIGPFQAELQVFNSRGGFWEIYTGKRRYLTVTNSRVNQVCRPIKLNIKLMTSDTHQITSEWLVTCFSDVFLFFDLG